MGLLFVVGMVSLVLAFIFPIFALVSLPCLLAFLILYIKTLFTKGGKATSRVIADSPAATKHDDATNTFKHPTKSSVKEIPPNPRFYNVGSTTFHKSKVCDAFSILDEWDATTESEVLQMGLVQCERCGHEIVFVYPRGRVYHKHPFCSDSMSEPSQMSESEAIIKGLSRCSKCY